MACMNAAIGHRIVLGLLKFLGGSHFASRKAIALLVCMPVQLSPNYNDTFLLIYRKKLQQTHRGVATMRAGFVALLVTLLFLPAALS